GNLRTQTDALGSVTSYAYDANNNRTSQSVTRTLADGTKQTLTTNYVYDGNNRLVRAINPDNSASNPSYTQVVYNNLGQQAKTIDELGRPTQYFYDADGRLNQTIYPDGTSDSTLYDNNGNRTQYIPRGTT